MVLPTFEVAKADDGVERGDGESEAGKGYAEVGSSRGIADAALARGDDDVGGGARENRVAVVLEGGGVRG